MDYWRQLDVLNPQAMAGVHVTLIGCGGIGSPTALALAKMGVPELTLYDGDTIEDHNLPNQMYRLDSIGVHKVVALSKLVQEFSECNVRAHAEHLTKQRLTPGIVVSGVDSMAARKAIFNRLRYNPAAELYVDARMGAEVSRIYTLNPCSPADVAWYEDPENLYSDEVALLEKCTEKAIIYNVFFIAALVANQVKRFIKGEKLAKEIIADLATLTILTDYGELP